jgi:hypothetical protein
MDRIGAFFVGLWDWGRVILLFSLIGLSLLFETE